MANAKSKIAAQFSIQRMNDELYLWTLTFAETLSIPDAVKRWRNFLSHRTKGLVVCFPQMSGIRVFELHPGSRKDADGNKVSHGLHIHILMNVFLDVNIVRKIWHWAGGGRCHVVKVQKGHAGYVAKYLAKSREECFRGMRLWAPIGECETNKVRDILVDSRWTATYQFLAKTVSGWKGLGWPERVYITARVLGGEALEKAMRSCRNVELVTDAEAAWVKEQSEYEAQENEIDERNEDA